jgi:radical SAM superfamily enzyme YgiQ (UPF0313 family)
MVKLTDFERPQRYAGNEWNVTKKDHAGKVTVALCFPDLYDVGMSNLGLRILYGVLNENEDIACERVFMPGLDLLGYLKTNTIPLFSLESKTPLDQFEIIGFNFSYELNFTNFLHMLDAGKVPIYSKERDQQIVIAGGLSNPEPIADFVDVFFIGEFEESAHLFIETLLVHKDKAGRLSALATLDGFYVPSLHKDIPIKRVWVKDLDAIYFPVKWLTPYTQIVHDRIPIEVARGCPHGCTFCQARAVYHPYRERSVSRIMELIRESYENTGYENFSLLSLSTSNYSKIEELLDTATPYLSEHKIGLSLPSLRVDDVIGPLYKKLSLIKKSSLTVAVEAGSDTLRVKLNKRIDTETLFQAAANLRQLGIRHIKLYFMYGFHEESDDDLKAIGAFIERLSRESRLEIHASINIFVPKPFSVWGKAAMDDEGTLLRKKEIILSHIPRKHFIKVDTSNSKRSLLEGICSRGDRDLGKAIYAAFKKGAIFDGDGQHFNWLLWQAAFEETGIDYKKYLNADDNPPWGFIK